MASEPGQPDSDSEPKIPRAAPASKGIPSATVPTPGGQRRPTRLERSLVFLHRNYDSPSPQSHPETANQIRHDHRGARSLALRCRRLGASQTKARVSRCDSTVTVFHLPKRFWAEHDSILGVPASRCYSGADSRLHEPACPFRLGLGHRPRARKTSVPSGNDLARNNFAARGTNA